MYKRKEAKISHKNLRVNVTCMYEYCTYTNTKPSTKNPVNEAKRKQKHQLAYS